jgi:hypothetical protein
MAFCGKCGQPVKVDARFCRGCGTPTGFAPLSPTSAAVPPGAYEDRSAAAGRGLAAPVLAGVAAGVVILALGGAAAWQMGLFQGLSDSTEAVGDAPAAETPLDEIAAWKASYSDSFLSGIETRYLTAEANLRDYPSSDGTTVLRSMPQGTTITGRFVQGGEADQLWFKLDEGGYVWDGNIGERASIYPAGMDGLFVGQSFAAFGGRIVGTGNYGQGPAICDTYESVDGRYAVMFENDVATAFISTSPQLSTKKGGHIGMSLDTLRQFYGDALVSEDNPYGGTDYYVWQTPDRGLRFYSGDGVTISTIWSGTQSIRYVEGCL